MTTQLLILLLLQSVPPSLKAAETACEEGRHDACLAALDETDRQVERSPRAESMRARALHAQGKTAEAYRSVRIYWRLAEGTAAQRHPAHKEMGALMLELHDALEEKQKALRKGWQDRQAARDKETRAQDAAAQEKKASANSARVEKAKANLASLRQRGALLEAAEHAQEAAAERQALQARFARCRTDPGACPPPARGELP